LFRKAASRFNDRASAFSKGEIPFGRSVSLAACSKELLVATDLVTDGKKANAAGRAKRQDASSSRSGTCLFLFTMVGRRKQWLK
jgi:hypothetical protein